MHGNEAILGDKVTFECSNGGIITVISEDGEADLTQFGNDEIFAYYDDLHIDAYNDMTVNVDGDTQGTVKHVTGDSVMKFGISSQEPNGKIDVKLSNLQPNAWYRLRFNGVLAACDGGRAHGQTNESGLLNFNEVKIPNE